MFRKRVLFPAKSHLLVYAAAFFSTGLCMGSFAMFALYSNKLEQETTTRQSLMLFSSNQSKLLTQQSLELTTLRNSTLTAAQLSLSAPRQFVLQQAPLSVSVPASTPTQSSVVATKQGPKTTLASTRTPTQFASVPRSLADTIRPVIKNTSGQPLQVATPVIAPAVGEATPSVTLEQAGIAGIDTASVRFKSGRQISVGGEFPSGEKLISVSPGDGKIVTDRRIILLAKPAPAQ